MFCPSFYVARRSSPHALLVVIGVLVSCVLAGCRPKDQADSAATGTATSVTVRAEKGPVSMTVTASAGEITIADKLRLSIDVTAPEGIDVELPQFGDNLDDFLINDFRTTPPTAHADQRHWKQQYDLDIYLSGDYSIPGITAKFTDRRNADVQTGQVLNGELSTDPIPIKVNSLLEGQFDPAKFKDIKSVVELPAPPDWTWLMWAGGGAAAVALGLYLLIRRRRLAQLRTAAPIPPHQWALNELARLSDQSRNGQLNVHELYFALSGVVRQYIEKRFSIMAAEQTTDEFLAALRDQPILGPEHKTLLRGFLQAADLVKFALHRPDAREIDIAFTSARDFVHQTAPIDRPQEAAA